MVSWFGHGVLRLSWWFFTFSLKRNDGFGTAQGVMKVFFTH
jgi:hypothetical protein